MPPLARLAVAAFAGVHVGALGASVLQNEAKPPSQPRILDPQSRTSGDRAIALVIGLTRPQDGLLYGEWFRERFADDRCLADPRGFEFQVLAQEAFPDGIVRFDVHAATREEAPVVEGCAGAPGIPALAAVWSDTGEVVPLGHGVNETSVAVAADERLDRRQVTDEGPLTDFRSGEAP